MSSFFTIPSAQKKRKRAETSEKPKKRINASKSATRDPKPARKPQRDRDDSISGSEDDSDDGPVDDDAGTVTSGSSEAEGETAAERRLRYAEQYLENKKQEIDEYGYDAEDIDRDLLAERLQEDVAESKGRMYRKLAEELDFGAAKSSWARWNCATVTSVATCMPWAYTVDKNMGLAKWRIQELPENQWLPKNGKSRVCKGFND